jgi:hypothetical protein
MSKVGFELTVPVFERVKTFCALDHMATVIDLLLKVNFIINKSTYFGLQRLMFSKFFPAEIPYLSSYLHAYHMLTKVTS